MAIVRRLAWPSSALLEPDGPVAHRLADHPGHRDGRQVLIVDRSSVAGHDPLSGEVLWRADWPNPGGGERVTPPLLLDDQRLLVSAGYGVGSRLFRIVPEGDGFAIEQLWDSLSPEAVPVTEAQRAELRRRLEALESGEMKTLPLDQVLSAIRAGRATGKA